MSTTTPILRPLTACLKALSLRPISARTITTTATGAIVLPRKVGMVHQPAAFHSPRTPLPLSLPPVPTVSPTYSHVLDAASPRRHIKVYPPPQKNASKSPIADLTVQQLAVLDPLGARQKLFSRHNRDAIRVGDILQVRRGNGEQPFAGVLINIRRRGVDTAFLLRGQVTRIGVEVWFKLYSPTIEGIDLVQRAKKRAKRAKLYYMRYVRVGRGGRGCALMNAVTPSMISDPSRTSLTSTFGSVPCFVEMAGRMGEELVVVRRGSTGLARDSASAWRRWREICIIKNILHTVSLLLDFHFLLNRCCCYNNTARGHVFDQYLAHLPQLEFLYLPTGGLGELVTDEEDIFRHFLLCKYCPLPSSSFRGRGRHTEMVRQPSPNPLP